MSSRSCPKCGRENREGSFYCSTCYAVIAQPSVNETVQNSSGVSSVQSSSSNTINRERPKIAPAKRGPAWGKIASAILAVLVVLAVVGWLLSPKPVPPDPISPDQVVRNVIMANRSNDVEKIRECFCDRDRRYFSRYPGKEQAIVGLLIMSSADQNKEIEVGMPVYQDDLALVPIKPLDVAIQGSTNGAMQGNAMQGSTNDNMQGSMNNMAMPTPISMPMTVEIALVKEDDKWQISTKETAKNMLKDAPGMSTLLNLLP